MSAISPFIKFDVEEFLSQHDWKVKVRASLKRQLANTSDGMRGTDATGVKVKSSNISNPTLAVVIEREDIEAKIADIDEYLALYDEAMAVLSDDEQMIIGQFYNEHFDNLEVRLSAMGISARTAYRYRGNALRKIREYIVGF